MAASRSAAALTIHPSELSTYHRNPRRGDVSVIAASLQAHGQYKPIVVNRGTYTGRANEVLAGNHTLMAVRDLAEKHPDDKRWQEVLVHWVDVDDDRAARIVLVDNRASEVGGYDTSELVALLDTLGADLTGTGFTEDDLASLAHVVDTDLDALTDSMNDARELAPEKRAMPLDLIFSSSACSWPGTLIAYSIGWEPGVISTQISSYRNYRQRYPKGRDIAFIDNEWHDYDHASHVAAVAEFNPKYATTRDIMTKKQCDEAGVQFLTFDEIMDQAADVAKHTPNVIVIPKHDILERIPEKVGDARVVLGYSVPSSYGQTEIVPERFAGRPVHLLGGPWSKQRALLALLGDDVVSLDNNQILKIARYGQVSTCNGTNKTIDEFPGSGPTVTRSLCAALTMSLTLILNDVLNTFGVEADPEKELAEVDDISVEH